VATLWWCQSNPGCWCQSSSCRTSWREEKH